MPKHFDFEEVMPHPNSCWVIRSKRGAGILGGVEWYQPWRQYVATFSDRTVWSDDCLADVATFMRQLNRIAKGPPTQPRNRAGC